MSWPTGRQFFTSAKRIAVGYISGWTFFSYLYLDMLNKYTLRFTKFFIYVSVKVFIKKYCLMALHSYLTVKVIQMYKFDSYASPRALFKNKKLYFSLESRRSAWGFLVRPWATNSRPSYLEEFEEPAESCIKVCIVSCFIHPKFFCQSGLILKVKALFWRAQSLAKLIFKKKKETDIKVKTFVKTGP